jgi:regulator of protease activity HflC (stomatin/prohibitin superfamily)
MKRSHVGLISLGMLLAACGGGQPPAPPTPVPNPYPPIRDTIATITVGHSLTEGILYLVMLLVALGGLYWWLSREYKLLATSATICAAAVGVVAYLFFGSYTIVPAGTIGVVVQQGAVQHTVPPGGHFILPYVQKIVLLPTREWTYITTSDPMAKGNEDYRDYSFSLRTRDGITAQINYTIQGQIMPRHAMSIVSEYGTLENAITQRVKGTSLLIVRRELQNYTALDLLTVVSEVEGSVSGELQRQMSSGGLMLLNFGFRTPELGAYGAKLEEARVAEQAAITEQQNIAIKEAQAKQAAAVAEGEAAANLARQRGEADARLYAARQNAEIIKTQADAESYATRTNAAAQAEANQLLAASITQELIEYVRWNRWDGRLPQWQTSGAPVVTIPAPVAEPNPQ